MRVKKTLKWLLPAAAAAGLAAFVLGGLDSGLAVRHYAVASGKIAAPVRLAVLSDLHSCDYGEGQGELVDAVAAQSPHLVLLCGDMVDDDPALPEEKALEAVSVLAARWLVCYVTGNHEHWSGRAEEIKEKLRDAGAVVLEGDCVPVTAAGQELLIAGVDDPAAGEEEWAAQLDRAAAGLDGEHFSILLTHRPERGEDYAAHGFDLALAGHAHGGQWRVPGLVNGLIAPDQGLFPKYAGGAYQIGDATLIVSRGLARESTRIPRLYNPPELAVVDLLPAP